MITKTCCICREEKPLSDFGKSARNSDGLRGDCKECRKDAGLGYAVKSKETYRDRITAILKAHDAPMWIEDLRERFKTTRSEKEGISSALRIMSDRGEISVSGGWHHQNSKKMITLLAPHFVPSGSVRLVRLSDTVHWHDTPIRSQVSMQSSVPHLMMFGA